MKEDGCAAPDFVFDGAEDINEFGIDDCCCRLIGIGFAQGERKDDTWGDDCTDVLREEPPDSSDPSSSCRCCKVHNVRNVHKSNAGVLHLKGTPHLSPGYTLTQSMMKSL